MIIVRIREFIRNLVLFTRHYSLKKIYKMNIASTARVSFGAKLDKSNPSGIYIAEDTYIASGAIVFSHDYSRCLRSNTKIGKRCFIGANAIIMSGVTIGDEVIVGAGAIVTKDVPSNCIVVGNPAKVIRTGIRTKRFGQLVNIK